MKTWTFVLKHRYTVGPRPRILTAEDKISSYLCQRLAETHQDRLVRLQPHHQRQIGKGILMKGMTDTNGNIWCVGDLVWRSETKEQGKIRKIVSQRIVTVDFPGKHVTCFVSGLLNLSRQKDPVPQL